MRVCLPVPVIGDTTG